LRRCVAADLLQQLVKIHARKDTAPVSQPALLAQRGLRAIRVKSA
jgi:hypothetical protein